jgi:hypothetical protein
MAGRRETQCNSFSHAVLQQFSPLLGFAEPFSRHSLPPLIVPNEASPPRSAARVVKKYGDVLLTFCEIFIGGVLRLEPFKHNPDILIYVTLERVSTNELIVPDLKCIRLNPRDCCPP